MRVVAALLVLAGCAHAAAADGLRAGAIDVGGVRRTYLWAGPPAGRHPLVIALHGRGGQGRGQAALSHLDELGRREGFVVVFPDGEYRSWADARGGTPASQHGIDDVAFVRALIDLLVADGRVDPARVYVTGMSNGAMMSYTLACVLADRVAAVAPVAGGLPSGVGDCAPARPISVIAFSGTRDPLVPYGGGKTRGSPGELRSADESVGVFARADGCSDRSLEATLPDVDPADGTRARTRTWSGCAGGTAVELVTIDGGGHTWPGGKPFAPAAIVGRTSRDIDASVEMWRFFAAHHR